MKDWEACFAGMSLERIRPTLPSRMQDAHSALEKEVVAAGLVPFLEEALHHQGTVTVVLNDPDRFTDSRLALEVVERIARARRLTPRIRILFAAGSHLFTPEQKRTHEKRCFPPGLVVQGWTWHEARDPSVVRSIGGTELHHWVAEAKFILAVGSMEPHYFAGVTGAHKTATVGVMSYEGLRKNHYHAMSPRAAGLALEGNPVFERLSSILTKLAENKHLFAVNEILTGGKLVACAAGEPLKALRHGLSFVRGVFSHQISGALDLVIARVAPPLDKNLYQADKGIKNVEAAVRNGGVILLEADCTEGVGPDRFMKLMERTTTYREAVMVVESEGYRLGDHKAVRLRALSDERGVRLGVVSSGLSEVQARTAGLELFNSREAASGWAMECLGEGKKTGALVEDAGNMMLIS